MGQYYVIANIDKKQRIVPLAFGDGSKLMEFSMSSEGVLTALAVLLASGNGKGGGDLESEDPIIGSWAGDRIVIAGDYADSGLFGYDKANIYDIAMTEFEDISSDVLAAVGSSFRI